MSCMAPSTFTFDVLLLVALVTLFPTVAHSAPLSSELRPVTSLVDESSSSPSAPPVEWKTLWQGEGRQKTESSGSRSPNCRRSLHGYSGKLPVFYSGSSKGGSHLAKFSGAVNSSQCKLTSAQVYNGSREPLRSSSQMLHVGLMCGT